MIRNWLQRLRTKEAGGGWDWLAAWVKGQGSPMSVSSAPDQVVWVYAAMDAIGVNASMPELQVKINDREVEGANEVKALLERPSPDISQEDALYITASQLALLGKSIWIKEPAEEMASSIRLPEWISFPDPRAVVRKPGNMGWTETLANGTKRHLPNEAIIHHRKPHPYRPMESLSKLGPLANTLRSVIESERFNADFFANGAVLSGFLKTPNGLTTKQRSELTTAFDSRHAGGGNRHKVGIFEGGAEWVANQATHRDMSFGDLDKIDRDKILAAFRVPPVEISILDTSNYNNAQEQRRIFWIEVILPLLKSIVRTLNYSLLTMHGRAERIEINTSGIQALQKDFGPLSLTASRFFDRGLPWAAIDQILELGVPLDMLGPFAEQSFRNGSMINVADPPEDKGSQGKSQKGGGSPRTIQPSLLQEQSLSEQATALLANSSTIKADPKELPTGDDNYDACTAIWQKNLEGSASMQKQMVPKYRRVIHRLRKSMLKALDEYEETMAKSHKAVVDFMDAGAVMVATDGLGLLKTSGVVAKTLESQMLGIVLHEYGLTEAQLETWLRDVWDKGIKLGAKQIAADAGFGSSAIPESASSILADKELKLSERLGAPREEVRKQISRSLDLAFQGEATFTEVIEHVRDGIKTASNNSARRAQTIARTETGGVVQSAKQAWATENGVTHMQWISARVDTTRDTHAAEDGNITKLNEPYPVTGLAFPKDPAGEAGEIINCLCDQVPVPEEIAARYEARKG